MFFASILISCLLLQTANAMNTQPQNIVLGLTDKDIENAPNEMKFKGAQIALAMCGGRSNKEQVIKHYKDIIYKSFWPQTLFEKRILMIKEWGQINPKEEELLALPWGEWKEKRETKTRVIMRFKDEIDTSEFNGPRMTQLFDWFDLPKSKDHYNVATCTFYNSLSKKEIYGSPEVRATIKELMQNFVGCLATELKKNYEIEVHALPMKYFPLYTIFLTTTEGTETKLRNYIEDRLSTKQ